jgi:serine/threonine protein kinase
VIDKGMAGEACYLVMEHVEGSNLRHILERGKLTPAQALHIVPQICSALEYAHARQIIHRDIKPENILITLDGEAKITDFGLARILRGEAPEAGTPLTGTQVLMGTVEYMAPEQRERARSVDHRADIYSLGVVFYEMLTGELPIGRFAPPSRKVAIDVRLDDVVLKALEKEPEQRYQRASHLSQGITVATSLPRPPQPRMASARLPDGQRIVLGEKGLSVLEPETGWAKSSAAAPSTRPSRISVLAVIAFLLVLLPLAVIVVAVILHG